MEGFRSKSDFIKHHIREFLSDNLEHERSEIIKYVRASAGENANLLNENMFSGCFNALLKENGYENPSRGIYVYTGFPQMHKAISRVSNLTFNEKVNQILESTIKRLEDVPAQKNPLYYNSEEEHALERIRGIVKHLKRFLNESD